MNNQIHWSDNNHPIQDPYSSTSVIAHTPRQESQFGANDCITNEQALLLQQYQQQAWCQGVPIESAYPYLSLCANWPTEFPLECAEQLSPNSLNCSQSLSQLLNPIGSNHHQIMPSHVQNNYGHGSYRVMVQQKRRTGGRRPKEEEEYQDLTDEDRQKRLKRRQRNKEAAARCRQRRLDLMNTLSVQVEELKRENADRDKELQELRDQKDELEYLLRNHDCKMAVTNGFAAPIIPKLPSKRAVLNAALNKQVKFEQYRHKEPSLADVAIKIDPELQRPSSLLFGGGIPNTPGIPISTPSNGLTPGFSFDNLLGQQTGLTPVNNTGLTPLFPVTSNTLETPMDCTTRDLENL